MTIPSYKTGQSREHDRERLAAWLSERELDRRLPVENDEAVASSGLRYDLESQQHEFVPGDICLLKPTKKHWAPVYMLILALTEPTSRRTKFGMIMELNNMRTSTGSFCKL